jgi:hypothetical protein
MTDDQGHLQMIVSDVYDLSQGVDWTPLSVQFPASPQEGVAMADPPLGSGYYRALGTEIENHANVLVSREDALILQEKYSNPESIKRASAIDSRAPGIENREPL